MKVKRQIYKFRLLSFETCDTRNEEDLQKMFSIQMFGVNERGKTACIIVKGYSPFFYVKVGDDWNENMKVAFVAKIGKALDDDVILSSHLIKRKKLYGFDGGKEYNFVQIRFKNEQAMKKAKGLWYLNSPSGGGDRRLNPDGYVYDKTSTILYEAQIPPLLRLFHIKEISPSGWIALPETKTKTRGCTNCISYG